MMLQCIEFILAMIRFKISPLKIRPLFIFFFIIMYYVIAFNFVHNMIIFQVVRNMFVLVLVAFLSIFVNYLFWSKNILENDLAHFQKEHLIEENLLACGDTSTERKSHEYTERKGAKNIKSRKGGGRVSFDRLEKIISGLDYRM